MSRTIIAATAVLSALALAACGGDSDSGSTDGSSNEPLRVGTEGTYAPFTFHDPSSNDLVGYDVEVIQAVGDKLGREVEFEETTWDSIFAGLEADRFDVIANQVTRNEEREGLYALSEPYTYSQGVIAAPADSDISSLADLSGKTTAQSLTSNWAEVARGAGAKVEGVEGFAQAVTLVNQGRVDATVNDQLTVLDFKKSNPSADIEIKADTGETSEQAFAARKDDAALIDEINGALEELAADGTLAEISEKYFGEDVSEAK